ncbi:MAG: HIT family protein, partial [Dongiaceae bacterium]
TAFSAISREAFAELAGIVADIEGALARAFAFDKINYLMLMMVDPHVHFHVLPRYGGERAFAGLRFVDPGWPRAPDLSQAPPLTDSARDELLTLLRAQWAERRP